METIERNARHQAQLIDDLLDVSRIITGKLRLEPRGVDLTAVIAAAVESVRPAAEAREIRLESTLDRTAAEISGDPNRLQQVLWNLLSNAIKFTPRGGRVAVRLERVDGAAQVTVTDSGRGIAPEFLPHVFERFKQADSTTTREFGGLGLGLAIVRHVTELHGGTVRADSEGEGRGATFTVTLPVPAARRDGDDPPRLETTPSRPSLQPLGMLYGVRVLVVDDHEDARDYVADALRQCGAEVMSVASAEEALEAVERWRPDVLVSDVGMPGGDGYDLIRRVRALPVERGGATPAAALTAYARADDRDLALAAGFQAHVPKPAGPMEIASAVAKLGKVA